MRRKKDYYYYYLKQAMDEERNSPAYVNVPTEKLIEGIAALMLALKGPLPNHERIFQASVLRGMDAELKRRDEPLSTFPKTKG